MRLKNTEQNRNRVKNQMLVLSQLTWLLLNSKDEVIEAFVDAGFDVDKDATPEKLKGILRDAVVKYKDRKHPKAQALIKNVATLLAMKEKEKSSFSNFFSNYSDETPKLKLRTATSVSNDSVKTTIEPSKEFNKKYGSIKEFYNKNKDTINPIATAIITGLFSRGGNQQVDNQINNSGGGFDAKDDARDDKPRIGLMIGIGVGALAVIGLTVYLVRRKK